VSSLQSRISVAEARGQFLYPEDEQPPLEAGARGLVNRQLTEVSVCCSELQSVRNRVGVN
jgi:hypothetical protein